MGGVVNDRVTSSRSFPDGNCTACCFGRFLYDKRFLQIGKFVVHPSLEGVVLLISLDYFSRYVEYCEMCVLSLGRIHMLLFCIQQ